MSEPAIREDLAKWKPGDLVRVQEWAKDSRFDRVGRVEGYDNDPYWRATSRVVVVSFPNENPGEEVDLDIFLCTTPERSMYHFRPSELYAACQPSLTKETDV